MRLGTYYRSLILKEINVNIHGINVLDVGCYDGYLLSHSKARNKIGIDLHPIKKYKDVTYVKGNIFEVDFKNKKFDKISALDVIEHVGNEKAFIMTLAKRLDQNGQIVLSAPHKNIKIFPSLLTNFVNQKMWRHKKNGYLKEELIALFPKNFKIKVIEQREFFFRLSYFPLRLTWLVSERLGKFILKIVIKLDRFIFEGAGGHIYLIASK